MKIPTPAATIALAVLASTLPARSELSCRPVVKPWTPACVIAIYVRHAIPAYDAAVLERPEEPLKAFYPLPQARQPHYRVLERCK